MLSPIEEIKNRLDILEVLGSYIKLQKAGANYRAVCPFHSEKRPSFFVSPARQIWHCFGGCGTGGDIFKFVMMIEGVEFGDALRILAQKAGVELKRQTPEYKEWQTERHRLHEICELTARFFERQLEGSLVGKEAKNYLLSRGIKEESLKKWRVGYAPDVWQGLSDFLSSRGYQKAEIEKAGLGLTSEKGSFYDRFRGRIIFPIFDLNSQVIGFGGRVFKEKDKSEIAKYVNTPQTLIYDKSRVLYGLDKAKIDIRKKDASILVEGYIDLIMAVQAGFENVVATSGTALTPFQVKILKRYSDNLLTAFDMDIAGDAATKRGINLAQAQGLNVKVITLPEKLDPADLILKDPKEWEEKVKAAKSIMDFYFESAFSKFDQNAPEGKRDISKILLPVIKRIPNRIVQSHWISQLSNRIGVKEENIEEEMKKVNLEEPFEALVPEPEKISPIKSRKELLEESLASLILRTPQNIKFIEAKILSCLSPKIQEVLASLEGNQTPDSQYFNYLALKSEVEEVEEKDIGPEIQSCLKEIQVLEINNELSRISQGIKRAEEEKDWEKIDKLSQEFNQLAKEKC
ncbi:MAG: DNA primase [bacterium]